MTYLADFVEEISDDFQSTFTVVNKTTLANMLGAPGDFIQLTKIIRKYIPNASLEFEKTNQMQDEYDIYIIRQRVDGIKPTEK